MTTVEITTPIAGFDFSYAAGQVVELEDAEATSLINAGYAQAYTGADAGDLTVQQIADQLNSGGLIKWGAISDE